MQWDQSVASMEDDSSMQGDKKLGASLLPEADQDLAARHSAAHRLTCDETGSRHACTARCCLYFHLVSLVQRICDTHGNAGSGTNLRA